jgi:hypothetical protein
MPLQTRAGLLSLEISAGLLNPAGASGVFLTQQREPRNMLAPVLLPC